MTKETMMSHNDLIICLETFFLKSGFFVTSCINSERFVKFTISDNNKNFQINANIRNICSAYLPNKPFIKRRQVGKFASDDVPLNQNNNCSMLIGFERCNDTMVMACWNPFFFVWHSTNRSCYVLQQSLENAASNGFYDGVDCSTPVLCCTEANFGKLLKAYLERYSVE